MSGLGRALADDHYDSWAAGKLFGRGDAAVGGDGPQRAETWDTCVYGYRYSLSWNFGIFIEAVLMPVSLLSNSSTLTYSIDLFSTFF